MMAAVGLKDPWTRLGLLGTWLASSVLFVHVPAGLWAGNVAEFGSRPVAIFGLGVAAVLGSLAIAAVLFLLSPRPLRVAAACLICAIGVVGWIYGTFLFTGQMLVLNGVNAPMDFHTRFGAWEMALVGAVCLLLAVGIGAARRMATPVLLMLNLGLVVATAVTLFSTTRPVGTWSRGDAAHLYRFSRRENVLLVLMDTLESDVVDEIFRADPKLKQRFEGFDFYKDSAGVAPTTFVSLPAIHSGEELTPGVPLTKYFTDSIRTKSFLNRFADAGYETSLVNPIDGVCPDRSAVCLEAKSFLHSDTYRLVADTTRLLDLSLFRVAPVWLKQRVYADGNWLVEKHVFASEEIARILEGNAAIRAVSQWLVVDDGAPTVKLLHLFSTHPPFVLNADCRTLAAETSGDRMVAQSRCALDSAANLLDRMKEAGVYDNTVILLFADHGASADSRYVAGAGPFRPTEWDRISGASHPVFLLKARDRRGPVRDAAGAVHLPDVAATVCAASGACAMPSGIPAGQAPPGRVRRFHYYDWKHEFWQVSEIPNMLTYELHGPVWDQGSWRRPGHATAYRLGDDVRFGVKDNGAGYVQLGWNEPEEWGRWTSERVAYMVFHLAEPFTGALDLKARVSAFIPPAAGRQEVTWVANGHVLDTWSFEDATEIFLRTVRIPAEAIAGQQDLAIELRISAPTIPQEVGQGNDARRLGVAFREMTLSPALGPTTGAAASPPPTARATEPD